MHRQEDMQGFTKEQDIITLGIRVWHVQEYDHCCLPETSYGQFHCGDTYVVRWQYMITNAGRLHEIMIIYLLELFLHVLTDSYFIFIFYYF